jgi:hypothetical protein
MNVDRIFLGLFVAIIPTAAVIFGLISFGIIALRKPPNSPDDQPNATRRPPPRRKPKARNR